MIAHKRPREGDGDHCIVDYRVAGDDKTSENPLLGLFGEDSIHEIKGDATFARGAFGELSVALQKRDRHSPSSGKIEGSRYSLVAVKTIHGALTNGSSSKNFFGSIGQSSRSAQNRGKKQQLSNETRNELLALRILQPNPNIVSLLAVFPAGNCGALSLAFEYCPIDLHEVLEVRRRTFQQPLAFRFIRTIFQDVFAAIAHCHDSGILHRDLKPGNLLVSSRGVIQLCDFGLAKPFLSFDNEEQVKSSIKEGSDRAESHLRRNNDKGLCTLQYRPPEVLLGGPSEYPSVDSWSAGVVFAEVITGRPLWPGRNVIDQLSLVFGSLGTPNEETWPAVRKFPDYGKLNFGSKPTKKLEEILARAAESPRLVDLLSMLLTLNPAQRITARDALGHEWLRDHATDDAFVAVADKSHRELRDELIIPKALRIPPTLFPENYEVVARIGLCIAESRRSVIYQSKECGNYWQGPTLTPLKFSDFQSIQKHGHG